jgi:hypothetical protein
MLKIAREGCRTNGAQTIDCLQHPFQAFVFLLMALSCVADGASAADRAQDCSKIQGLQIPASAVGLPTNGASVVSAELVTGLDAGGPRFEYCRILGAISPPPVTAKSGTPQINFQLNLPTNWNGKAVHMGGGGYNGTVVTGTAPILHILGAPPLQQGYATFGSDSGHVGLFTNAEFAANEGALLNFAYEHIKKTHDAAIALITTKYGRAPSKTYFAGASTGGREGLTAIQRYPSDYDGVVINAPAIYFSGMRLVGLRVGEAAYGKPGAFVSASKLDALRASVLKVCDADDGATDEIVSDVEGCRRKQQTIINGVRCSAGEDSPNCLTEAQLETVRAISDDLDLPYELAHGMKRYPGYNILQGADFVRGLGLGTSATTADVPTNTEQGYLFAQGEAYVRYFVTGEGSAKEFNAQKPGKYLKRLVELSEMIGAMNPDTSAFQSRGGKLIVTHGLADEAVSSNGSIGYYKEQVQKYGQMRVDAFFRLYMIPGFGHGVGTFIPSWNGVEVLDKWVSQGIAPEKITAIDVNPKSAGRTRPLCAFPTFPRYKGSGSVEDAANFECLGN